MTDLPDLERILHEYLVKDLLALRDTRVGYPTLMTVFAGAELIGSLVADRERGTDGHDFRHFWTQYLYPASVRPKTEDESGIIYEFARHGVMHHFFPKGKIGVTGSDPGGHLTCNSEGVLILDVKVLVDDFVCTYRDRIVRILETPNGQPSRASMQKRLDDIRAAGKKNMPRLYGVFDVPRLGTVVSPVSGPTGPV
jgi:hypothetical protein